MNEPGGLRNGMEKPTSTTFSRLKGTIRCHLQSMAVARRPSIPKKAQFSKLEGSSISSIARRRAEGISLCKQKIQSLTGHGNVKRKPMGRVHPLSAKNTSEQHTEERPLLMASSVSSPARLANDTAACQKLPRDYTFDDLEKSFTSAVDELRFHHTSHTTPDSMANSSPRSWLSDLHQHDPKIAHARGAATTVTNTDIRTSRPQQYTFSVSRASLVPTLFNGQQAQVNPLKCHPNVTGIAKQSVDTSGASPPPMGRPTPRIKITKEASEDLDNAPIYSPSSGNLSQYSRLTPSPARSTASSFHTAPLLALGSHQDVPYYTPTRSSGRSAAAEYAAHQKHMEMAVRRSSPKLFADYEQARMSENREECKVSRWPREKQKNGHRG